jgi:putative transposase
MSTYTGERISTTHQQQLYFWTATVNSWKHLLAEDQMKMEIIQLLQWLKARELIAVYAFVIMPNHMHLVWQLLQPNGKESAKGSLLKFTAHRFRRLLLDTNPVLLETYRSTASKELHEFWQPDSQAFSA